MNGTIRLLSLLSVLLLAISAPATAVMGADMGLDQAKAEGWLGERPDGYLGMVKPAPEAVAAMMRDINTKRRARYEEIAQSRGTPRAAVEAIAGAKLLEQAPSGAWIMDASGRWFRK